VLSEDARFFGNPYWRQGSCLSAVAYMQLLRFHLRADLRRGHKKEKDGDKRDETDV
jgi:hypothetical protein